MECSMSKSFIMSRTQFNLPGHTSSFLEFFSDNIMVFFGSKSQKLKVPISLSITSPNILSFIFIQNSLIPSHLCHLHPASGDWSVPSTSQLVSPSVSVCSGPACRCYQMDRSLAEAAQIQKWKLGHKLLSIAAPRPIKIAFSPC